MWLKYDNDATVAPGFPRCSQGFTQCGRMMCEIVYNGHTVMRSPDLEATIHTGERGESVARYVYGYTEFSSNSDRGEGVADIVFARNELSDSVISDKLSAGITETVRMQAAKV